MLLRNRCVVSTAQLIQFATERFDLSSFTVCCDIPGDASGSRVGFILRHPILAQRVVFGNHTDGAQSNHYPIHHNPDIVSGNGPLEPMSKFRPAVGYGESLHKDTIAHPPNCSSPVSGLELYDEFARLGFIGEANPHQPVLRSIIEGLQRLTGELNGVRGRSSSQQHNSRSIDHPFDRD